MNVALFRETAKERTVLIMVIDIGEVKRHIKPKADSTLLNMRKADLIDYIRCLEKNYNVAVSFNENQARYIESLTPEDCRPQGRWISERCNHVPHRLKNPEKWVTRKCSLCGYSNGRKQSNYCPSCGAKMDMDGKEQVDDN